jgi:CheY-like chemotaxis protein/nitrogen-specific signal transduction histidine kinase
MQSIRSRSSALHSISALTPASQVKKIDPIMANPTPNLRLTDPSSLTYDAQAIGALTTGIAHDFNNVFAGILSHLDLVLHAEELPASLREYLVLAQTSARRGAELVGHMTALSHRFEPRLKPIHLGKIMTELTAVLQPTLYPRITLRCVPPPPQAGWVMADESQITQVLINLSLNARDALPQGGTINLETSDVSFSEAAGQPIRRLGDYVRLTVRDTGEGMPPEVLNRFRERNFTTKALDSGAGLSLAVAYNIVRAHNGWMEAESQPGQGTCLQVYLPQAYSAAPPPPSTEKSRAENPPASSIRVPKGKKTILVADDEQFLRSVVCALLTSRGYQVVEAASGEEAIEKFSLDQQSVALVVLDIHMERLSGWDTLTRLRQAKPSLPAILLSGTATDADLQKATQMGQLEFLAKPFENHDLLRLVKKMIDSVKKSPS